MEETTTAATNLNRGGGGSLSPPPPWRARQFLDLNKSFKLAIRSLLTCCSNQEFKEAFSRFNNAEQQSLHHLFIQVITSLHKMIEDEFESLCLETQVGSALDMIEQLVEEQNLDPLFAQKTNVMDAALILSLAKKNEIQYLRGMLEKAEEQNRHIRDRVELLKQGRPHDIGTAIVVEKFKSSISNYGTYSNGI